MRTLISVLALVGLGACSEEAPTARAPLTVPAPTMALAADGPAVAEVARPAKTRAPRLGGGGRSTGTAQAVSPTDPGARGVSSEFPWGNGDDGPWAGTGSPDPEPLKKISDEEMMKRATDLKEQGLDRQHALVSIGRRHLPGAIEAFRQAMDPGQDRAVREMALSGLMEHGRPEALPLMWEFLRNDPSPQLRGMAVWAVCLYGSDEALKAIDYGLADPALMVQNLATLAIWALKDRPEDALPRLQTAVESDEQMLWQEGLYNLSRLPYAEAGDLLERAVKSATDEAKQKRAIWHYRVWRQNFPDLK